MIYTFYSFKGGVGRSMALANLAEVFHARGLRVLAVDWDLEAPGLESYFQPVGNAARLAARPSLSHPGLLDLLITYRSGYPKLQSSRTAAAIIAAAPDPAKYVEQIQEATKRTHELLGKLESVPDFLSEPEPAQETPTELASFLETLYADDRSPSDDFPPLLASSPLRRYLQCIHPPEQDRDNGVYLLSAGAREAATFAAYAEGVQDFDWTEFYVSCEGRNYFSWLREQLSALADVVLIDSRTGVTEMGGVCTRHLPDAVVSFCAPNVQNVDGVLQVMSGVNGPKVKQERGERHVDVLVIPTRIDLTESDRLEAFSKRFAEKVEGADWIPDELADLPRPLWNLQIPYIPRYNYHEERVLGPDVPPPDAVGEKLAEPYRRVALHLAVLGDPERHKRLREAFAGEIASQFPQLMGGVPQMAPPVSPNFVGREDEIAALKAAMLRSASGPELVTVVAGPAGIGKSMVVARACRDLGTDKFPHGILWVRPGEIATPELAQQWLRTRFGEKQIGERALREKLKDRRFLIVVDDVRVASDVAYILSFGERCARVVITRDSGLLSGTPGPRIFIGPLDEQARFALIGSRPTALGDGEMPDLVDALLRWPLSASLVRGEIDRRLAQGEPVDRVYEDLRQAFKRHGILAFDQPGMDRSTSVARTLRDVIYGDSVPRHVRAVLLKIAAAAKGLSLPEERTAGSQEVPPVRRLTNLGLVATDTATGHVVAHPLVRAFLIAEGELDDTSSAAGTSRHVSSSKDQQQQNPDVERAKAILRGQSASLDDIENLAESLKNSRYFGYARQLFARARRPEFRGIPPKRRLKLAQRHALCTYKDNDLPADQRFDEALRILGEVDLNAATPSQETLGQAGAIYKNIWRLSGRRRDLERSAAMYERGHEQGVDGDYGYTGINAAFVHDLIAAQQRLDAPEETAAQMATARAIRTDIVNALPRLAQQAQHAWLRGEWWYYATMAETCFGLNRQDEARYWLREGLPTRPPDWQLETTTRQLAELAYAQNQPLTPESSAWRTLGVLVGHAGEALRAITLGKVGLALSGGGFRASLFHIGVLAHLAEVDLLRHVEVLSCVSGGSIIGAHYYLEIRKLLREKPDREITRDDYVQIVKRIEREFLGAVQLNLRTRLFASVVANLRTLFDASYTRTSYLGRLFERHIYARVADDGCRTLEDMTIAVPDADTFNPKLDNWRRAAKGPVLLLNATTLNTGHNWQFAVSWMGEPPLGASSPVDRNNVLRRMYYWEAPPRHKKVPLGRAVAASACVPALFDPVEMKGLFPDQIVRLVDGGVHDNQGITGLLEQECTVIIVSDASGQTNLIARPSGEVTSVPMRANDILMGRVREAEYRELSLLRRSSAIRGLMFLHLKKDLDVTQLDWVGSQEFSSPPEREANTSYGIPKTVQALLAGVRTDLDSFSDREAYSLMLSGYEMAKVELRGGLPQWEINAAEQPEEWRFKAIERVAKRATGEDLAHAELLRQLTASAARGNKIWKLSAPMRWTARILLLAAVAASAFYWRSWVPDVPWRVLQAVGAAYVAAALLFWLGHRLARTGKSLTVIVTALVMVPIGAVGALVHLAFIDPVFLFNGAIDGAKWRAQIARRGLEAAALIVVIAAVVWQIASRPPQDSSSTASGAPPAGTTAPSTPTPAAVLSEARGAQTERDFARAVPLWTQILASQPANLEALGSRAYAHAQLGELELAADDYTMALAIRRDPAWLRDRAYVYKLLDRLDESRSDLTALLSLERDERTVNDIRYLDHLQGTDSASRPRSVSAVDARPPARIYVLLADPLQEIGLDAIKKGLTQPVLVRPPSATRRAPDMNELRYVYDEDAREAKDIADRLPRFGIEVKRLLKVDPGRARPRHFELWLSRDTFGGAAR